MSEELTTEEVKTFSTNEEGEPADTGTDAAPSDEPTPPEEGEPVEGASDGGESGTSSES